MGTSGRLRILALLAVLLATSCGCRDIRPPAGYIATERDLLTTGYCKCRKCCGWEYRWGRPVYSSGPLKGKRKKVGVTASGSRARRGTIAADTRRYPFGTVMYVPGYGYGRVEDRGGVIAGQHVDLYFSSHREALRWGRQKKSVKVWLPKRAVRRR